MNKADNETGLGDVRRTLREYSVLTLTGILDSLYLIIWAAVQWYADYLLSKYHFIGMNAIVQVIVQVLFAFSTIFPLCLFIYRDFRIAWLRVNRQIENEAKRKQRK